MAAVLLVGLLTVLLQRHTATLPALPGTAPLLRDVVLSPTADLVRGEPPPPLAVERPLYVHFFAADAGTGLVLLLDPQRDAELLTPRPLSLADELLGPFRVARRGQFALLVIATETTPNVEQIDRIVAVASAVAKGAVAGAALQPAAMRAFADAPGLSAVCLPFELR